MTGTGNLQIRLIPLHHAALMDSIPVLDWSHNSAPWKLVQYDMTYLALVRQLTLLNVHNILLICPIRLTSSSLYPRNHYNHRWWCAPDEATYQLCNNLALKLIRSRNKVQQPCINFVDNFVSMLIQKWYKNGTELTHCWYIVNTRLILTVSISWQFGINFVSVSTLFQLCFNLVSTFR